MSESLHPFAGPKIVSPKMAPKFMAFGRALAVARLRFRAKNGGVKLRPKNRKNGG